MLKKYGAVLLSLFIISYHCSAQFTITKDVNKTDPKSRKEKKLKADSTSSAKTEDTTLSVPKQFVFKPILGMGTGMFSFYGDLYSKHLQPPSTSRIGFDMSVGQKLSPAFTLNLYVLFGKLGANERQQEIPRNLNFESQIRVGGFNLLYNFDHLLPEKRKASPYLSIGFESFEFLSKTDMKDKNGNKYYYWSDGSIRDIDEQSAIASTAIELQRDYKYESDIREMNLDSFGKYPERSFAIPVGAGFILKLSDRMDFKIGSTMHFTFTDYVDGVSNESFGTRVGNSKKDVFMMTSFSLHYDLIGNKKGMDTIDESYFKDVDYFALDLMDLDKDGVRDALDSCQGTPINVKVDAHGCPLDDDGDGVPNYLDKEAGTPLNAIVDMQGVQMSDSLIALQWLIYSDSTGMLFAKTEYRMYGNKSSGPAKERKEYTILIGSFQSAISPEAMTRLLSIPDVNYSTSDDNTTTYYTAGNYLDYRDADKRKKQLIANGITDAIIVFKKDGKYVEATNIFNNNTNNNNANNNTNNNNTNNNNTNNNNTNNNNTNNNTNNTTNTVINDDPNQVIFRVQLGAFSKPLSKNTFAGIPDLIELRTEGIYKYSTKSYTSLQQAAERKVDLTIDGYKDCFIVAYKGGKRITLAEAGAQMTK